MAKGRKNLAIKPVEINDALFRAVSSSDGLAPKVTVHSSVGVGKPLEAGGIEEYRGYIPDAGIFLYGDRDRLAETRAQRQSTGEQWKNGVIKLAGKTGTAFLGGTVGTLVGTAEAAANGSFNDFFDNSFQHMLDNWNNYMDINLPNYYTKEAQEYNLGRSLGTANFWANDVLGGLSFTIGALLTEAAATALAGATGGLAAPVLAGTTLRNTAKAAKVLKNLTRATRGRTAGKAATFARQLATGAFYEAGVEARHFKEEARETYLKQLGKTQDQMSAQEIASMEDHLNRAANGVFAANAALVSFGNFMTLPHIFGYGLSKASTGTIFKTSDLTKRQASRLAEAVADPFISAYKTYSKTRNVFAGVGAFAKPLVGEGFIEEGGQSVIQNSALAYTAMQFDPIAQTTVAQMFEAFGEGLEETYGSKEGWKEIGIGMIIGGAGAPNINYKKGDPLTNLWTGGAWGAYTDVRDKQKATDDLVDWMNNNKDVAASTKAMWQNAVRQYNIAKAMDESLSVGDFFAAKNAENDNFFSFVSSRIKGGFYSDIEEELVKSVEELSPEEFGEAFGYSDMTEANLAERKEKVVKTTMERVKSIKKAMDTAAKLDKLGDENIQLGLAYNIAAMEDVDRREEALAVFIEDELGGVDTRELSDIAAANADLRIRNSQLSKYKKQLAGYKSARTRLEKARKHKVSLKPELTNQIEAADKKIKEAEKKVEEYEKELQEAMLEEEVARRGEVYRGDITSFSEAVKKNLDLRYKMDKVAERDPTNREDVETALKDLESLAARRESFIDQYNNLMTKEGQKNFLNELGTLRDLIGDRLKNLKDATNRQVELANLSEEGKYIKSLPKGLKEEESPETAPEEDKDSDLRTDSTSEAFNDLKNKMLAELDSIPKGTTLTEMAAALKKRIDVLKKYIKKFQEMIDAGVENKDLYQKMVDNLDVKLEKAVQERNIIEERIADEAAKPEGKVIFRAQELTQIFIDFISPSAKKMLLGLSQAELREKVTIEVRDHPEGGKTVPAKGSKLVDIFTGITQGDNQGKGVYLIYDGEVIGGLKDPNRFKLKNGTQLNPLNTKHLALLNPRFVDGGVPSTSGAEVQRYYKALDAVWKQIYEGKTSFTQEEVEALFYINKSPRIINLAAGKDKIALEDRPTLGEFFNTDQYALAYTYEVAGEEPENKEGIVFFNEGLDEIFVREAGVWRKVELEEERQALLAKKEEALTRRPKLKEKGFLSSTHVLVTDGEGPTLVDARLPVVDATDEDFAKFKQSLRDMVADFQDRISKGEKIEKGGKIPNADKLFLTLKNVKNWWINPLVFINTDKTSGKQVIRFALSFKRGDFSKPLTMDVRVEGDVLQVYDAYTKKWVDFTPDYIKKFVDYRIKNPTMRAKYGFVEKGWGEDPEFGNFTKEVVPDEISEIKLNATIDAGFSAVPKEMEEAPKGRKRTEEEEKKTFYNRKRDQLVKTINEVDKVLGLKAAINSLAQTLAHINKGTEGTMLGFPDFKLKDIDRAAIKKLIVNKYKILKGKEGTPPPPPPPGGEGITALPPEAEIEAAQKFISKFHRLSRINPALTWDKYKELGGAPAWLPLDSFEAANEYLEKIIIKYRETKVETSSDDEVPFHIVESLSGSELDFEAAKAEVRRMLPDTISVKELDTLFNNLVAKGVPVGAFKNFIIHLHSQAEFDTVYHEAFHAVFRTLLTDRQISNYLSAAKNKYGKVTQADLDAMIARVPRYIFLDRQTLENLYYEERMAEDFQKYASNAKGAKPKGRLGRYFRDLWNRIKRWFGVVSNVDDEIDLLFSDIYTGAFKTAKTQYNVYTSQISEPVFALLKKQSLFGDKRTSRFIDQKTSDAVINTIARNVYDAIEANGLSLSEELIANEIAKMQLQFSPENWQAELLAAMEENLEKAMEVEEKLNDLTEALEPPNALQPNENYTTIIREVKKRLNLFIESDLTDTEYTQEENEDTTDAETWMKSPSEIGGFGSLSKEMKTHISFVPVQLDLFGISRITNVDMSDPRFTMSANGYKVYNGVSRALANTPKHMLLHKLRMYGSTNEQANAWIKMLFSDIRQQLPLQYQALSDTEIAGLDYEILSESNWYNRFVATFNKEQMHYYTALFDPTTGTVKVFNANQRGVGDIQFDEWATEFEAKGLTSERVVELLGNVRGMMLSKAAYRGDKVMTDISEQAIAISEYLDANLGIKLSPGYIQYSIIKEHLASIKEDLEKINPDNSPGDKMIFDYYSRMLDFYIAYGEEIPALNDNDGFTNLIRAAKLAEDNPRGFFIEIDGDETTGAVGRLKGIAKANALFDESVGESTFQNAEGKTIYDKINPSYYLTEARAWGTQDRLNFVRHLAAGNVEQAREILRASFEKAGTYISEYDLDMMIQVLKFNPLIRGLDYSQYDDQGYASTLEVSEQNIINQLALQDSRLFMIDGLRQTNLDADGNELPYGAIKPQAAAFRKLDQRGKTLMNLIYFADSSGTMNTKRTPEGRRRFRMYNIGVNAEKSTAFLAQLPVFEFYKDGELSNLGVEWFKSFLMQEFDRIQKVKKEIESGTDTVVEHYHTKSQRGLQFFHFKSMPNREKWEKKANNTTFENLTAEEQAELTLDLKQYAKNQFEEYLGVLSNPNVSIIEKEKKQDEEGNIVETGEYTSNVLPKHYMTNNRPDLDKIGEFFFNDYFNTFAYTALLDGDYAMNFKDPTDVVKRNSGKVASGPDLGGGTTKIAVVQSIETPLEVEEEARHGVTTTTGIGSDGVRESSTIDTTDAQTHGTVKFYIKYLKSQGKYVAAVKEIYKKINRGIEITEQEGKILMDLNADMRPRKIVGRDRSLYLKTSLNTLHRNSVSHTTAIDAWLNQKWDEFEETGDPQILDEIHNAWKPIPGREKLHTLLNKMEKEGIDLLAFDSGVKTARKNVGTYSDSDGWQLQPFDINTEILREQVITDGNKSEIVDGTQKLNLIWSEHKHDAKGYIRGKDYQMRKIVRAFDKLLGLRSKRGFEKKSKSLFNNPLRRDAGINYPELHKAFQKSLAASGADPYLLELFQVEEDGTLRYNWNFPAIVTKYENMWLAYVSKQTLKQKAPGRKYTLVSDFGFQVIEHEGKVIPAKKFAATPGKYSGAKPRRLKHRVEQEGGGFYSEMIVSQATLDLFGINIGDSITIPAALAEQVGVRIPTQDKHSMVTLRAVDVLPREMGNSIILPQEVILLSGADFDIDALYARVYSVFRDGKHIRKFGDYLTSSDPIRSAYKEFLTDRLRTNEEAKAAYRQLKADHQERITELFDELDDLKKKLKELKGLPKDLQREISDKIREARDKAGDDQISYILGVTEQLAELKLSLQDRGVSDKKIQDAIFKSEVVHQLRETQGELSRLFETIRQNALRAAGLPATQTEFGRAYGGQIQNNILFFRDGDFGDIDPITDSEVNNLLLELEFPLVHNEGNKEAAATPATMKAFYDLIDKLAEEGIISKEVLTAVHDAASKSKAANSIDVGAEGIGPTALFNVMFQRLHASGVRISQRTDEKGNRIHNPLFGKYDSFENRIVNGQIQNEAGERINDLISSVLSAMTDNAKEQLAAAFNLSIDTLGPALTMIGMGIPFETTMLFMKQPAIRMLSELMTLARSSVKTKNEVDRLRKGQESLKNLIEEIDDLLGDPKSSEADFDILDNRFLIKMIKGEKQDEVRNSDEYKLAQREILMQFATVKQYSDYLRNLSTVLGLNKGMKPTWAENETYDQALADLGISVEGTGRSLGGIKIKFSDDPKMPFEGIPRIYEESEYIKTNMKIRHIFAEDSKKFFIANTNLGKRLQNRVKPNFKENTFKFTDNLKDLRNQLTAFLQAKAYRHMTGTDAEIDDLFDEKTHSILLELLAAPEFRGNRLLRFFRSPEQSITDYTKSRHKDKIFYGRILKKLVGNTRTAKDPDLVESLMSSYKELFFSQTGKPELDAKAREFAGIIFKQVFLKDNFQFRNNSVVRQIEPFFLGKAMKSLTAVQDLLGGSETIKDMKGNQIKASFEAVFGVSEEELLAEFEELFSRFSENNFSLRSNKLEAVLKGMSEFDKGKKPLFFNNETQVLNIKTWAATKEDRVKNLLAISKTGIFSLNEGGPGIIFPRFIRITVNKKPVVFRLASVNLVDSKQKTQKVEDLKDKDLLIGWSATYEPTTPVGSKEVMPYAFTTTEWDVWITANKFAGVTEETTESTEQSGEEEIDELVIEMLMTANPGMSREQAIAQLAEQEKEAASKNTGDALSAEEKEMYDMLIHGKFTHEEAMARIKQLREGEEESKEEKVTLSAEEQEMVQFLMHSEVPREQAIQRVLSLREQMSSHFRKVSREQLELILNKLSNKFGIKYQYDTSIRGFGMYDRASNTVFINPEKARLDTAFHEFAHPFIAAIKEQNSKLYRSLVRQIRKETNLIDRVKDLYSDTYRTFFLKKGLSGAALESAIRDAVYEEAIVQALGEYAAGKYDNNPTLLERIAEFLREVAAYIKDLIIYNKEVVPSQLPVNTTIQDLAALMNTDNKITLGLSDMNNNLQQSKLDQLGFKPGKCK